MRLEAAKSSACALILPARAVLVPALRGGHGGTAGCRDMRDEAACEVRLDEGLKREAEYKVCRRMCLIANSTVPKPP